MAKRTNRVAWALAGTLAIVVAGGTGLLLHHAVETGRYQLFWVAPGWRRFDFGIGSMVAGVPIAPGCRHIVVEKKVWVIQAGVLELYLAPR